MKTIGVILAGGESSRFGEDKSLYTIEDKPMYMHAAEVLRSVSYCDEIVVSASKRLNHQFELDTIEDVYSGYGPVGGLYSVSEQYPGARLIVISCDTPFVTGQWVDTLIKTADEYPDSIIISADHKQQHPLVGVYQGENLTAQLKHQIETKRLSMRALFEHMDVRTVDVKDFHIENDIFRNINYKSDLT